MVVPESKYIFHEGLWFRHRNEEGMIDFLSISGSRVQWVCYYFSWRFRGEKIKKILTHFNNFDYCKTFNCRTKIYSIVKGFE